MGNYISSEIDNMPPSDWISLRPKKFNRLRLNYKRMELDSKLWKSQALFYRRKLQGVKKDYELNLQMMQSKYSHPKSDASQRLNKSLKEELVEVQTLKQFLAKDKKLLKLRIQSLEKQLKIIKNNQKQTQLVHQQELETMKQNLQNKKVTFFKNKNKHTAIMLNKTKTKIPNKDKKTIITSVLNYVCDNF
jgi:hypothetical protein